MHIEIEMRGVLTASALFFVSFATLAQESDTVNLKPYERYWTKPRIIPNRGFAAQEVACVGARIAWHNNYVHPLSLASAGPYFTIDGLIKGDEPIFGPK